MSDSEYESEAEWYGSDDEIEDTNEIEEADDTEMDIDTDLDTVWDPVPTMPIPAGMEYARDVIVIKPEDRQTSHIMSQYEFSNIIEIRTAQISEYANCLVDTKGLPTAELQARKELLMRKTPLVIRREFERLEDGKMVKYVELWHPHEMTIPMQYFMRY